MAPRKTKDEEDHLLVASVVKAMQVLEAYDGSRRSMGFSEIARVTGLERSAAQRAAHDETSERVRLSRSCQEAASAGNVRILSTEERKTKFCSAKSGVS